jgi:hypothetical protein
MDGIIYRIRGEQTPDTIEQIGRGVGVTGGSADFDIVYTGERPHTSCVSEAIVQGSVQWSIRPGLASADEISAALAAAEQFQRDQAAAQKAQTDRRARERAELPAKYPWLIRLTGSGKSSHALGAANLKTELARTFPGTRFSVKSESYSGGDSIRIRWELGPTSREVEAISQKYCQGSFDGMTDS